ncbi:hypothetical protein HispidOSU_022750, partial [Sigmodon hispidus]
AQELQRNAIRDGLSSLCPGATQVRALSPTCFWTLASLRLVIDIGSHFTALSYCRVGEKIVQRSWKLNAV